MAQDPSTYDLVPAEFSQAPAWVLRLGSGSRSGFRVQ